MKIWLWLAGLATLTYSVSLMASILWKKELLLLCSVIKFGVWDCFCTHEDALLFYLASFGALLYSVLVPFTLINFRFSTARRSISRVVVFGVKSFLSMIVVFLALVVYVIAFWSGWFDYEFYSGYAGLKFLLIMLAINCYLSVFIILGFTRS
jgi:hypothetical protein